MSPGNRPGVIAAKMRDIRETLNAIFAIGDFEFRYTTHRERIKLMCVGHPKFLICAVAVYFVAGEIAAETVTTVFPTRDVVIAERVLTPVEGEDFAPVLQRAIDETGRGRAASFFSPRAHTALKVR